MLQIERASLPGLFVSLLEHKANTVMHTVPAAGVFSLAGQDKQREGLLINTCNKNTVPKIKQANS